MESLVIAFDELLFGFRLGQRRQALGAKTIDTLYAQGLAPLPKSESKEKLIKRYHERFHWPLSLAILLLAVEMLFPEQKREPRTRTESAPSTRRVLAGTAALLLLAALPGISFGSPSSALRAYQAGNYDQALKEYEQLLERKSDDPRLHFNAGTAAYRNRRLEQAAKEFNEALSSPDLKLQGQAYYNRGNTLYHLGESDPDPAKRQETWQKALQDYQSSLKLDRQDSDAKFNYEFVKQKLEELKQQQQQKKNDKSDQQKDQDKQQQKDQQSQESKKDQDKNSQAQQNKENQKQDSSQKDQQAQQQKEQEQQQQKAEEDKKKEQQTADKSQEQKDKQQQEAQQAKQAAGQPR